MNYATGQRKLLKSDLRGIETTLINQKAIGSPKESNRKIIGSSRKQASTEGKQVSREGGKAF